MKKYPIITALAVMLVSCNTSVPNTQQVNNVPSTPSISKAVQAVLDEGYTNPVTTGTPLISCGKEDSLITSAEITATNSNGKKVYTRYIGEQHVKEDCFGYIPSAKEWVDHINDKNPPQWMIRTIKIED